MPGKLESHVQSHPMIWAGFFASIVWLLAVWLIVPWAIPRAQGWGVIVVLPMPEVAASWQALGGLMFIPMGFFMLLLPRVGDAQPHKLPGRFRLLLLCLILGYVGLLWFFLDMAGISRGSNPWRVFGLTGVLMVAIGSHAAWLWVHRPASPRDSAPD